MRLCSSRSKTFLMNENEDKYKSHEKSEMIRPEQIFLALRYLRKAGHRDYQFYDEKDAYLARCKIKDQRGLRLLQDDKDDIEEDLGVPTTSDMAEVEDHAVNGSDGDGESVAGRRRDGLCSLGDLCPRGRGVELRIR